MRPVSGKAVQPRHTAAAVLCAAIVASLAAVAGGCAPSVRYTRDPLSGRLTSFKVKAGWDYRAYYQVPDDLLTKIIDTYIGVPYRYGGTSRRGLDCSGLVFLVFRDLNRATAPRTTGQLHRTGRPVNGRDARPGDLLFFRGGVFNTVNHVGIYVGGGRFAHASSKVGVTYDTIDGDFYRRHFAGVRRVF